MLYCFFRCPVAQSEAAVSGGVGHHPCATPVFCISKGGGSAAHVASQPPAPHQPSARWKTQRRWYLSCTTKGASWRAGHVWSCRPLYCFASICIIWPSLTKRQSTLKSSSLPIDKSTNLKQKQKHPMVVPIHALSCDMQAPGKPTCPNQSTTRTPRVRNYETRFIHFRSC